MGERRSWLSRHEGASLLAAVAIYIIAWGSLAFSGSGVFWDDWLIIDASESQIREIYSQLGNPFLGELGVLIAQMGPAWVHVLQGVLFFLAALFFARIVRIVLPLSQSYTFMVMVLFLTIPLFAARNSSILVMQIGFFVCFLAGWYLLEGAHEHLLVVRLTAAALFILSFNRESNWMLFLAPMLSLALNRIVSRRTAMEFMRRYGWFLMLPVSYVIVIKYLYDKSGDWENYNSFSTNGLKWAASAFVVSLGALLLLVFLPKDSGRPLGNAYRALGWGILLIGLAVTPFLAVGKSPISMTWNTRFQMDAIPGVCLVLLAGIQVLRRAYGRTGALTAAMALVASFALVDLRIGVAYWRDWKKQESIIAALVSNEEIRDSRLVFFLDASVEANIFGRELGYYEWNALLRRAYGDEQRFAVSTAGDARVLANGGYAGSYSGSPITMAAGQYSPTSDGLLVRVESTVDSTLLSRSEVKLTIVGPLSLQEAVSSLPEARF